MMGCAGPIHGWELTLVLIGSGALNGAALAVGWYLDEIGAWLRERVGR